MISIRSPYETKWKDYTSCDRISMSLEKVMINELDCSFENMDIMSLEIALSQARLIVGKHSPQWTESHLTRNCE